MTFLNKIRLTNKKVYILGGFGLIGSKVVASTLSIGAKVIILDVQKKQIPNNVKYEKFDCSKLNNLEKNFNRIILKFGGPDVFINCSYPRTKDWGKSSFNKITLKTRIIYYPVIINFNTKICCNITIKSLLLAFYTINLLLC